MAPGQTAPMRRRRKGISKNGHPMQRVQKDGGGAPADINMVVPHNRRPAPSRAPGRFATPTTWRCPALLGAPGQPFSSPPGPAASNGDLERTVVLSSCASHSESLHRQSASCEPSWGSSSRGGGHVALRTSVAICSSHGRHPARVGDAPR